MGGGNALFRGDGSAYGGDFLRGGRLPGVKGRPGVRGRDTDSHNRRRPHQRPGQEGRTWTECHHPIHRRLFRGGCRRSDIHPSCHLHPRSGSKFHADVPVFPAGRHPGHPVPDSVQEVLRQGDAHIF